MHVFVVIMRGLCGRRQGQEEDGCRLLSATPAPQQQCTASSARLPAFGLPPLRLTQRTPSGASSSGRSDSLRYHCTGVGAASARLKSAAPQPQLLPDSNFPASQTSPRVPCCRGVGQGSSLGTRRSYCCPGSPRTCQGGMGVQEGGRRRRPQRGAQGRVRRSAGRVGWKGVPQHSASSME